MDLSLLATGVALGVTNKTGDTGFADPYHPRGQKQLTVDGSRNATSAIRSTVASTWTAFEILISPSRSRTRYRSSASRPVI